MTLVILALGWLVLSFAVAFLVGRSIALADRLEEQQHVNRLLRAQMRGHDVTCPTCGGKVLR